MQSFRFRLLLIWFLVAFITLIVVLLLRRGGTSVRRQRPEFRDQSPAVILMSFFIFWIVIYGEAIRDFDARFNIVLFVLPPALVSAVYLKIIRKRLK